MHRSTVLAAAILLAAGPTFAQEAPASEAQATPPAACAPAAKKGAGVGSLLSAARRAGVGQILANQSMAGGKGSVAGAILGTAISAADTGGSSSAPGVGGLFGYGNGKAAAAAAATGTAIEVARSATAPQAPPCPQP